MQREADLLRCSKLNVYAEFNRMVQAIARLGPRQAQMRFAQGTSEEYRFYANLADLLRQVINNPDAIRQREDLRQVYQWFHDNKPLVTQTIKPSQRKPTLAVSDARGRPYTTPLQPTPPPSHIQRPHTTADGSPLFPAESLSDIAEEQDDYRDAIALSPPSSQVHSRMEGGRKSPLEGGRKSPMEGGRKSPLEGGRKSPLEGGRKSSHDGHRAHQRSQTSPAVISLPSDDFPAKSGPRITFGNVLEKATGIAASMTLQREQVLNFQRTVRQTLSRPATVPVSATTPTPINSAQPTVPINYKPDVDPEHGSVTQTAMSCNAEGNTQPLSNKAHPQQGMEGNSTTLQKEVTNGPHPLSTEEVTNGPHPLSIEEVTNGPPPLSQEAVTGGLHPSLTDGPHTTQLGVCPPAGNEPRLPTREGTRPSSSSTSVAMNTLSLLLPKCCTPQSTVEPGVLKCRPLRSPTKKGSRVMGAGFKMDRYRPKYS